MIHLRYVVVPPELLEVPEKLGNRMPLERAMAIMMLDPDTRYHPIDIAHFCYKHAQVSEKKELKRLIGNARHSYAEMARLRLDRSNPNLKGKEWVALLQGNLHAVATKMEELRQRMEAQPGVIFTIVGDQLLPHPKPAPDPAPEVTPKRQRRRIQHRRRAMALTPETVTASAPHEAQPKESELEPNPLKETPSSFNLIHEKQAWRRWKTQSLALITIMAISLGVVAIGVSRGQNQPLHGRLEDVQYVIEDDSIAVGGAVYRAGDKLQGQTIRTITLERVILEHGVLKLPSMTLYGQEMIPSGRCAVYPGAGLSVVGYFEVGSLAELNRVPTGTIGWSRFRRVHYPVLTADEIWRETIRLTGVDLGIRGNDKLAVGRFTPDHIWSDTPIPPSEPFVPIDLTGGIDIGPLSGPRPVLLPSVGLIVRGGNVWCIDGKADGTIDPDWLAVVEHAGKVYVVNDTGAQVYDKSGLLAGRPLSNARPFTTALKVKGEIWYTNTLELYDNQTDKIFFDKAGVAFGDPPASLLDSMFDFKKMWSFEQGDRSYIMFQSDTFARKVEGRNYDAIEPLSIEFKNRGVVSINGLVSLDDYRLIQRSWRRGKTIVQLIWASAGRNYVAWGSPDLGVFQVGVLDDDLNVTPVFQANGYPIGGDDTRLFYAAYRRTDGVDRMIVLVVACPITAITNSRE